MATFSESVPAIYSAVEAYGGKRMNHADYPRRLRRLSIESIRHIDRDAREAIESFPGNPSAGYYADEVNYCAMELKRRGVK